MGSDTLSPKMNLKMNWIRNKKELVTFYLSKLFSMKNCFIKNYEAFEGKVCIGCVYTLAEKVI